MPNATYADLNGRAVFVTGGGSGIGASIVSHFAEQGAKVGFVDIATEPSERLVEEIAAKGHPRPKFVHCDLRDIAALRTAIDDVRDAIGPIRVLVSNAAHDERHDLADVTPEYWDDRMAVNLRHQFFAAQAVAPDMEAAGGGSIINFGSVSWMLGIGTMPAYTTAKAGVQGLTRSLARRLGPANIRVNTVVPGWIMTERQVELWLDEKSEAKLAEDQCLPRKLYPADVARMVLFLASDDSSACTNQDFIVDGGWV